MATKPDTTPQSTRLFLALWPDPDTRQRLLAWREAWTWPRAAAPVHSDKLHVTLHFLGPQPSERLPELLDGFQVPSTPFSLQFGRAAIWHNGVAVLEPSAQPPALLDLHARLSQALAGLGLQPEARQYRPHVTMARRAAGAGLPQDGPAIDWHIDRYVLVESSGGSYTVLRDYLI